MDFMSREHKERFEKFMELSKASVTDRDRVALFYIISGSEELSEKIGALYDFKNREIHVDDWFQRADFSSGFQGLVQLAFNLYNGYEANLYDILSRLSGQYRQLAIQGILVRFPCKD